MAVIQDRGWDVVQGRKRAAGESRRAAVQPGGVAGWVLGLIRRQAARSAGRHMQVVETLALGGRRQLMLVRCDGERYLVGAGADAVDTIVRVGAGAKAAEEAWN